MLQLKDTPLPSKSEGRGTGIRKIRNQMQLNNSPEPNFITDDDNVFFMTELLIHSEFEAVTERATVSDTVNDTVSTLESNPLKPIQNTLLELIQQNPRITIEQMANRTEKSVSTMKRHLKQLQERNLIRREGSDKAGYWKLLKELI